MTDGEKAMGILVALMGATLGQAQTAQYGVKMDTSAENILQDEDVRQTVGIGWRSGRMKKIKIKVGFRYDGEIVIKADDDEWKMILKDEKEVKNDLLKDINYYLSTPEEDANGTFSDWNFEAEEVKE